MTKEKTKLKDLKVSKVDFVDQGANPDASILITKRKGKIENVIEIIKSKLGIDTTPSIAEELADEVVKASQSFNEKIAQQSLEKTRDEMWNVCYALQGSFISILMDEELNAEEKSNAMKKSAEEFETAIDGFINKWCKGLPAEVKKCKDISLEPDVEVLKSMKDVLQGMIDDRGGIDINRENIQKGGCEDMKIDKSAMSPEDLATFEKMAKAYGWEDTTQPATTGVGGGNVVKAEGGSLEDGEDIYKGLNPEVKAEIESLKKFKQEKEEEEIRAVAKKYEILGKKPEELVPVLKSLRAAGGTAYDDMIAVLDSSATAVEKSGMFSEVGKSGHRDTLTSVAKSEAEAKAETIAKGYMEKDPKISFNEAIAKAWEDHPELIVAYDDEAGF